MIHGILPALITPMTDDGSAVNYDTLAPLVDYLIERGCTGFFVCGGTGEGLLMTAEERRNTLEIVMAQAKGRAAVVAHIGAMATQDAQALAAHAASLGVDGVAAVPPFYFKVDRAAIVEHYRLIGEAAGDTPLWIYQIPSATGVDITADIVPDLMAATKVSGIKYSAYNLYDMANIGTLGDINVLSGFDEVLVAALSMGAHGAIGSTYNVMPATFSRLFNATQAGDWETARTLQAQSNRVIRALLAGPMIAGLKAILTEAGLPSGAPRRPIPPLAADARRAYLDGVAAAGLHDLEAESLAVLKAG